MIFDNKNKFDSIVLNIKVKNSISRDIELEIECQVSMAIALLLPFVNESYAYHTIAKSWREKYFMSKRKFRSDIVFGRNASPWFQPHWSPKNAWREGGWHSPPDLEVFKQAISRIISRKQTEASRLHNSGKLEELTVFCYSKFRRLGYGRLYFRFPSSS